MRLLPLLSLTAAGLALASAGQAGEAHVEALLEALPEYDARRLADCAESATPVLNEVCSVGSECDEDVRVADFVELYNPQAREVDLGCFVVAGLDDIPFIGRGQIPPGEVRGFPEAVLGFRIKKSEDEISLYRLTTSPEGGLDLLLLEEIAVDDERAHSFRSPDGGAWQHLDDDEAEEDWPGTFGDSNSGGAEEPSSTDRGDPTHEPEDPDAGEPDAVSPAP
jgi:hypothetical protein